MREEGRLSDSNQNAGQVIERRGEVRLVQGFPHRLGQKRGGEEKKNRASDEGGPFCGPQENASDSIDALQKEQPGRTVEKPTGKAGKEIDDKKKGHENQGSEKKKGSVPVGCPQNRHGLVVSNRHGQAGDKPEQRKTFTKEALEVASQSKEGKDDNQNGINDIDQGATSVSGRNWTSFAGKRPLNLSHAPPSNIALANSLARFPSARPANLGITCFITLPKSWTPRAPTSLIELSIKVRISSSLKG